MAQTSGNTAQAFYPERREGQPVSFLQQAPSLPNQPTQASVAAEKVDRVVIPSEARNLSSSSVYKIERFLGEERASE
jgi:hypothetical protein